MNNSIWDNRFIALAEHIASWSKDPSTQVGAVIVDDKKRIVSVGFNGYPMGIPDDDLDNRQSKYGKIIHAEQNAILFSKKDLTGFTIYVWPMPPCTQCASTIIQSGITRVVTCCANAEQFKRWGDKIKITEEMFNCVDIEIKYI